MKKTMSKSTMNSKPMMSGKVPPPASKSMGKVGATKVNGLQVGFRSKA